MSPLPFYVCFFVTLCSGILSTENGNSAIVLTCLAALGGLLQRQLFGWRLFPLDRAALSESLRDSEIYFKGAYLNTNLKDKKEKKFLDAVYETSAPLFSKIVMVLFAGVYFVSARSGGGVTLSGILQVAAVAAVVPIAAPSHYVLPLAISAAAFLLKVNPHDHLFFSLVYGVSFFLTCGILHWLTRNVLLAEKERTDKGYQRFLRSAASMAGAFLAIYVLFDLFIPDPRNLQQQTIYKNARALNGRLGSRSAASAQARPSPSKVVLKERKMILAGNRDQKGMENTFEPRAPKVEYQKGGDESSVSQNTSKSGSLGGGSQTAPPGSDGSDGAPNAPGGPGKGAGNGGDEGVGAGSGGTGSGGNENASDSNAGGGPGGRHDPIVRDPAKTVPKQPDPQLVSEAFLMLLVTLFKILAIAGGVWIIYSFFTKKPALKERKSEKPPEMKKEDRDRLREEFRKLAETALNGREAIIRKYEIFLKMMAAAKAPKEDFLPPLDYSHSLCRKWPRLGTHFENITGAFSDTLYGEEPPSEQRLRLFEDSFRVVAKSFLMI